MRSGRPIRARGAALLALVAIIALGGSWFLVRQLNAASGDAAALRKARNAEVLNRAKEALIGYVAAQAANSGEDNPGAMPCPEAAGYFDNPADEGKTASSCMLPKVGRFPWRTIGTEKLVDSAGEPLWYVVSTGWAVPNSTTKTNINSNSPGQLTVDGVANAAVALIIAPGAAFSVPACGANPAVSQVRPTAGMPDWRNYLECENATYPMPDATFVTTGTSGAFNDQVLAVTVADIMPAIEAAVAKRIARDIVPQLQNVYAGTAWGLTAGSRLYPFAAPFADPGPGAGTSDFKGVDGTYQGLLPFNQVDCTAGASNPRCLPGAALTSWATFSPTPSAYDAGGWGYIQAQSCWWESGNVAVVCEGEYHENDTYPSNPGMRIEMQVTLRNVAMGLRRFDAARMQVEARDDGTMTWIPQTVSHAKTINADGSLTITFWADLPNIDSMGWGTWAQYRIRIERLVVRDHALLDPDDALTGWFARNEWFRLLYYAAAWASTADGALPGVGCTSNSNCLRLLTWPGTAPAWDKRALLVLAGRALRNQTRPSTSPANYVELQNNDGGTLYEQRPVSRASQFTDRVVVVDSN
jgi:hypothetical protein